MPTINQAISDSFVLRDYANVAITGKVAADFATLESYVLPGGATTATVTLNEIGSGEYGVTFTPTVAVTWVLHVVYNSGGVFREFSQTYVVDAIPTPAPPSFTGSLTRLDLRREIGKRIGEGRVLTATATGTDTTFIDINNLTGPDNAYRGGDIYFPALGVSRRLSSSTQATSRATWSNPLNAATQVSDVGELWNERGVGVTAEQANGAINSALINARGQTYTILEAQVTAAFDADDPSIALPATITRGMYAVRWQDSYGSDYEINRANAPGNEGWYYDQATGTVIIGGASRRAMRDATVWIKGFGEIPLMNTDAETTSVNAEWIIAEAVAICIQAARNKNPDNDRWTPPFSNQAAYKRPLAAPRNMPNAIVFR